MGRDWKPLALSMAGVVIAVGVGGWVAGGWLAGQRTPDRGVVQCQRLHTGAIGRETTLGDQRMEWSASRDPELRLNGVAMIDLMLRIGELPGLPVEQQAAEAAELVPAVERVNAGLEAACAKYGYTIR